MSVPVLVVVAKANKLSVAFGVKLYLGKQAFGESSAVHVFVNGRGHLFHIRIASFLQRVVHNERVHLKKNGWVQKLKSN